MGDRVFIRAGDGARPRKREGAAPSRRRTSTWWEVMHPEGSQGTWRDLPRLLADSLRLVWSAGRNIFLLTASLQLVAAFGIAVQLFVGKEVLDAVLGRADLAPVLERPLGRPDLRAARRPGRRAGLA